MALRKADYLENGHPISNNQTNINDLIHSSNGDRLEVSDLGVIQQRKNDGEWVASKVYRPIYVHETTANNMTSYVNGYTARIYYDPLNGFEAPIFISVKNISLASISDIAFIKRPDEGAVDIYFRAKNGYNVYVTADTIDVTVYYI